MDAEPTTPIPEAGAPPAAAPEAPAQTPPATPGTLLDGVVTNPAEPQVTTITAPKWVNEDGTWTENWRENFKDPALKADATLTTFKDVESLAKSYVEARRMIGKRDAREAMPALDDPPEKWAAWRKLTGAPETPTGYGELRPDTVPKEQWDASLEGSLRTVAHKYGAAPALVKELAEAYTTRQLEVQQLMVAQETQKLEQGKAALREAFGQDFSRQMAYAAQGAAVLGFSPDNAEDRAFFTSPKFIQAMARAYSNNFLGDRAEGGRNGVNGLGNSIDDKIAELRKSDAYRGKNGIAAQQEAQKGLHQLYAAKRQNSQPFTIRQSA